MLWILIGFAVFMVLLCLLRLQLRADFDEIASLVLQIGPIPIRLLPQKKSDAESQQPTPQEQPAKSTSFIEKLKSVPRPSAADLMNAWQTLGPVIRRALRRTRRGIRVHPLTISVILGGREDPARTAEYYGYAQAAVWSIMPALEQLLKIPDPSIHIGMDFDAETTKFRGSVGISMRIGTLILLGLGISIPALCWFLKYLKRKNNMPQQPAGTPAA